MNAVSFYTARGWIVTSPYGTRINPVTGKPGEFHHGIDFAGKPIGEHVHTPFAGVVRASGIFGTAGNVVAIKSNQSGLVFMMFHLHTRLVKVGDKVISGQLIGTNGSTGSSTGAHIHFEIRYDKGLPLGSDRPVWGDPANYEENGMKDIKGHWAEKEIKEIVEKGLMVGFPDGTFRPNEPATRAQLAVVLSKLLDKIK